MCAPADKQKLDAILNKPAASATPGALRARHSRRRFRARQTLSRRRRQSTELICRPTNEATAAISAANSTKPEDGISISTATGCARNAASSAYSVIPTPRRSPRSVCTLLQHRGQEAAGIVAFDGRRFHSERRLGLVGDHFSHGATIERLPGASAVGHVRYSTTGETILRNVQPLFAELDGGGLAVAHNGNLTNGLTLRRELVRDGAICQSTSDTEAILHLVARSRRPRIVDRFIESLRQIEGAYALVALTNKKLIGARDPLGIRPLVLGELNGSPILPPRPARSISSAPNSFATLTTARSW